MEPSSSSSKMVLNQHLQNGTSTVRDTTEGKRWCFVDIELQIVPLFNYAASAAVTAGKETAPPPQKGHSFVSVRFLQFFKRKVFTASVTPLLPERSVNVYSSGLQSLGLICSGFYA